MAFILLIKPPRIIFTFFQLKLYIAHGVQSEEREEGGKAGRARRQLCFF
jgi:hypothetical protein